MNGYLKYIDWPGKIQSVQRISYKWLSDIIVSLHLIIPFISMTETALN
jgi:hypothetical protein